MKYPCSMIQDLLPLFYDGVCSEETADLVREHLAECANCRDVYEKISAAELPVPSPVSEDEEVKKAASLKRVGRKMKRRTRRWKITVAIAGIALAALIFVFGAVLLKTDSILLPMAENLRAYMEPLEETDSVIMHMEAEIPCEAAYITQQLVPVIQDGEERLILFVRYYAGTMDYYMGTLFGGSVMSYHAHSLSTEDAEKLVAVYYCGEPDRNSFVTTVNLDRAVEFSENMTDWELRQVEQEEMEYQRLQSWIQNSQLIWMKK